MEILLFLLLLAANGELPPANNPGEYPVYVAEDNDQSLPVVEPVVVPDVCDARCALQEARQDRREARQAFRQAQAGPERREARQALREARREVREARREVRNNP